MTNAVFIQEVLRVVHDREKLDSHEQSEGRSHSQMEAGRAWSYKEILELVQIYDAGKRRGKSRDTNASLPAVPPKTRKRRAEKTAGR